MKETQLGNCLPSKGAAISQRSKTTKHNNANSASAKEAVNNYDLWINEWMYE